MLLPHGPDCVLALLKYLPTKSESNRQPSNIYERARQKHKVSFREHRLLTSEIDEKTCKSHSRLYNEVGSSKLVTNNIVVN